MTANPQFTAPFASALTSANTKTLFLDMTKAELALGTILEGGFFTDSAFDFTSLLNNETWDNAGFEVYVRGDGLGTDNRLNGQGYYNWRNPAMFGWDQSLFMSTAPRTGPGGVSGQVMLLTVAVPEPSTLVLVAVGVLTAAVSRRRGFRRPSR